MISMATGDLKNNLRKLQAELRAVKYDRDVDYESLGNGMTTAYLPIYHYMFVDYSRPLAEKIAAMDVEMFGKTDLRFMEAVYKVLREMFSYKPPVTKDQFFSAGFGECKVIMCMQILQLLRNKHKSLLGVSRSVSARQRASQTLPSPVTLTTTPSSANHEISEKTRLSMATVLVDQATCQKRNKDGINASRHNLTPSIVSRVINETRSTTAVTQESPGELPDTAGTNFWSPVAAVDVRNPVCSSPDELRLPIVVRETSVPPCNAELHSSPGDTAQNILLAAVNKITSAFEVLCSRLDSLDGRLSQLESLEQRLKDFSGLDKRYADFSRIERRITQLERSSLSFSTGASTVATMTVPTNPSLHAGSLVTMATAPVANPAVAAVGTTCDLITNQLNNLTARMTLAENKLTMLQSQATPAHGRFPMPEGFSPELLTKTVDRDNTVKDCRLSNSPDSKSIEQCDSKMTSTLKDTSLSPDASVQSLTATVTSADRCTRSEQLERIQAMMRGTEELLQIHSCGSSL